MGWFDDQIRQRKLADQETFEDSFLQIAGAVMGQRLSALLSDKSQMKRDAIGEILKYFRVKPKEIPDTIKDMNEALEYAMRPYGIMRRSVHLTSGWYRDAVGPMIGTLRADGSVVALIPAGLSGYTYFDAATGRRSKVSRKTEALFDREALCFYKPFPTRVMDTGDLLHFMWGNVSAGDLALFMLSALAVTGAGMIVPYLNAFLFSEVVSSGSVRALLATGVFLICAAVGGLLFGMIRQLLLARIGTKLDTAVEAAVMARLLSLPASFFKGFGSGELANRVQCATQLVGDIANVILSTGITCLFALLYIPQIALYAPSLALPALVTTLATVSVSLLYMFFQARITKERMGLAAKQSGMSYALISGVQKIRQTGAEKRALARWGRLYAKEAELLYNPPLFLKTSGVLAKAAGLFGTLWMYAVAHRSGVSVSSYYAFTAAYGMVSGAFAAMSDIALTAARIPAVLDMLRPILEAEPEISEEKQVIEKLSGAIELNNVTFRYQSSMPPVLDNLSVKIRPNQYVAIVGTTGCGKSTLLRILLGMETPQKGAVYYDGRDITRIDLKSLRRKIGVVMQNGKLFTGNIYSNITLSAPWLTMEEAWEAADMAGMREDIEAMPMGMFTLIGEGAGGFSGGQRQRLMIARAIAPKPKILMFDEATSALDNVTQKRVSESLNKLRCTRIIIAHRLSTVKNCDRILVLDKGKIVEDGKYKDLIEKNGVFAQLVSRQMLDDATHAGKTVAY